MVEPTTVNKALIVPLTGDLVGSWGTAAMNPNFVAIDGMLGGFTTISVSAATTVLLTTGTGTITPGAGPAQQQNFMVRFTGSPSGTATYQFSSPGSYLIDNQCLGTTFPLIIAPAAGTGTQIGVPPGRKTRIAFDGTNVDFENPEFPGQAIDLHGVTSRPPWMTVCTMPYALVKDGSTYSASLFPALAASLGSTFGGNGVTTFGVPDERARMRIAVDTNGPGSFANRVTSVSGINGSTMGAAGGDERMPLHGHSASDSGHTHGFTVNPTGYATNETLQPGHFGGGGSSAFTTPTFSGTTAAGNANISVTTTGSGSSQNMPPTIVSFLALVKT